MVDAVDRPANDSRTTIKSPPGAIAAPAGAIADFDGLVVPSRGGLRPQALRRIREYVLTHLQESIDLRTLAGLVDLSPSHFVRAFKQSVGMTPHRFLLQCRVRRVQQLLAETDLRVSEIALAAGFSDQSHCTLRFRKLVGMTPSRYRWLMR
jgi:AraC-like DNA-binding protein